MFQYLDDTGTTVSLLAERARMTKQAMAELVSHLETHGYVRRVPDPADGRAKLVLPTARGNEVVEVAQSLAPEIEERIATLLGAEVEGPRRAPCSARGRRQGTRQGAGPRLPRPLTPVQGDARGASSAGAGQRAAALAGGPRGAGPRLR